MKLLVILSIVYVVYAREKSECEVHREREQKNTALGRLIPECEENGDYKGLQCHGGTRYCQCWDKEGHPITAPSMNVKACECHREKKVAEDKSKGMVGAFIPTCEDNGHYSKMQCWGSTGTCWCVDETGKKTSEPTRDEVNC
uniref:Putative ctenitoxin-like protein n=1 Tax=Megacormus gertschi TaxID=1843536 RepID=A0A224X890_9SCOR